MPNLPLASLDGIERAALALVEAVRSARGVSSSSSSLSLSPESPTVLSVSNEFLLAKARALRADNYLRVSHSHLTAFCRVCGSLPVATVSARVIEEWLCASSWSPVTRKNHLLTVRTLFWFAASRSYVIGNPALAVDLPLIPDKPPEIHTPDQVAAVLELARAKDLNLCRWLAVRYFAGLRGREAALIEEGAIHAGRGFLEVTAEKSKTRRRRIVTIAPALAAWLEVGGKLPLGDVNTKVWRLTGSLPFKFPRNVTRHSFVSYHLAQHHNAAKTALEAGHAEQIMFNHYRELVTSEDAAAFWAIRPK